MLTINSILLVLLLSIFTCETTKIKLHKEHLVKVKPDTLGETYKKQGLEVPFDDKEGLGGEPVGHLEDGGRLDGLGGDMQGYPVGMGAGAEPLGAYDRREEQGPPNFQQGGMQQGLDEGPGGYGGQPMGFSREGPPMGFQREGPPMGFQRQGPPMGFSRDGNDAQPGDFIEGRAPVDNDGPQGFRPSQFGTPNDEAAENVMGPQQMQMQGFMNPNAAMGESLSNNIDAMDKANIQGDSEVGDMVRARGRGPDNEQSMFGPAIPQENRASFMDDRNRNPFGEGEYRNFKTDLGSFENLRSPPEGVVGSKRILKEHHARGGKRVLAKIKRKQQKWKGFKPLRQQGYKDLQG